MGSRKKSATELKNDLAIARTVILGNILQTFFRGLFLLGCFFFIAWAFVKASPDLAGKNTNVDLGLRAALELFGNKWGYWAIIALMGGGCYTRNKSNRKRIDQLSQEKQDLESIIDSRRSSSGMKRDGTSPEDRT